MPNIGSTINGVLAVCKHFLIFKLYSTGDNETGRKSPSIVTQGPLQIRRKKEIRLTLSHFDTEINHGKISLFDNESFLIDRFILNDRKTNLFANALLPLQAI